MSTAEFELTQQTAVEQQLDDGQSHQTSSDSDLASSYTESDTDEHHIRQRLRLEDIDVGQFRIHGKSKVIHLLSEDLHSFECGRAVSSNHHELSLRNINSAEAVVCVDCSKAHQTKLLSSSMGVTHSSSDYKWSGKIEVTFVQCHKCC